MINKIINSYISPLKNINGKAFIILIAIFINATGQLFLIMSSLYFSSLSFTIYQIGIIIAIYNGGVLFGSLIGGNKSEQFGIKLMKLSLLCSGLSMISMLLVNNYFIKSFFVFLLGLSHGVFKPASIYCLTHIGGNSLSLLSIRRFAVNLGMSFAASLGSFLSYISYNLVFVLESIASFTAFYFLLKYFSKNEVSSNKIKDYKNIKIKLTKNDIVLYSALFLNVIIFAQIFTTYPLYLKNEYNIDISTYGTIFTLNGLMILLFEIPISHYLENFNKVKIAMLGTLLFGTSFIILPLNGNIFFLYFDAILWTLGEILFFAVILSLIISSNKENKGMIIGLFQFTYSFGMLCGPLFGTIAYSLNSDFICYLCFLLSLFCICILSLYRVKI